MDKESFIVIGPVSTASAYGELSRTLVRFLSDLTDSVSVLDHLVSPRPRNVLQTDNPLHEPIIEALQNPTPHIPDVSICVSTPDQFKKGGKVNIGLFRGTPRYKITQDWIDGMNRMNLVLVTSSYAADILQKIDQIQPEVLYFPELIDMTVQPDPDINSIIEGDFLLVVDEWDSLQVGSGKNSLTEIVSSFIQTYSGEDNPPKLVLKTWLNNFSLMDRRKVQNTIEGIRNAIGNVEEQPEILLLHGWLTEQEMAALYQHPDLLGIVSINRKLEFNRTVAEARLRGTPILAMRNPSMFTDAWVEEDYSIPVDIKQIASTDNFWMDFKTEDLDSAWNSLEAHPKKDFDGLIIRNPDELKEQLKKVMEAIDALYAQNTN